MPKRASVPRREKNARWLRVWMWVAIRLRGVAVVAVDARLSLRRTPSSLCSRLVSSSERWRYMADSLGFCTGGGATISSRPSQRSAESSSLASWAQLLLGRRSDIIPGVEHPRGKRRSGRENEGRDGPSPLFLTPPPFVTPRRPNAHSPIPIDRRSLPPPTATTSPTRQK